MTSLATEKTLALTLTQCLGEESKLRGRSAGAICVNSVPSIRLAPKHDRAWRRRVRRGAHSGFKSSLVSSAKILKK